MHSYKSQSELNVLFIPDYRGSNPYQALLADALEKKGVRVSFRNVSGIMGFRDILRAANDTTVIHLHWVLSLMPVGRTLLRTLVRMIVFAALTTVVKRRKIPIIWTVHNILSHDSTHPLVEMWARRIIASLAKKLIIHSSSAYAQVMREYHVPHEKCVIIPHGNYIGCCPNTISRMDARATLDIPADAKVFLFIGAIKPYKGYETLLTAFTQLADSHARLLVVGKPATKTIDATIRAAAAHDVRIQFYPEFVDNDRMQIYMNAVDVVVLPYKKILTSGAAVLAMSFGKAIIAPDIGPIRETVAEEGSILYAVTDTHGLIYALETALRTDTEQLGDHNRRKALKWDWDTIAALHYEVYRHAG